MPLVEDVNGSFHFSGNFAFLSKDNTPNYALLQFDNPFTGRFDRVAAENTSLDLQGRHQEGDPAHLEGSLVTVPVNGHQTRVLFYLKEV